MKKYFYLKEQDKEGPVTLEELKQININPKSLIWFEGLNDWTPAEEILEIRSVLEIQPPPILSHEKKESIEIDGEKTQFSETNEEKQKKYQSIGGWLYLLCFALIIGGPLSTFYNIIISFKEVSPFFNRFPGLKNLLFIDGFLSFSLMVLSIRAGLSLWNIEPGAVKKAKNYLIIFLGYTVIQIFLPFTVGLPPELNINLIPEVIKATLQSLFFFGIWFWYLNVSKRVKSTYVL